MPVNSAAAIDALERPGLSDRGPGAWEEPFWMVFERSANPCLLLDEHRRIIELNRPALALLGKNRLELLGASLVDSIDPAQRARSARDWFGFLRSGELCGTRVIQRPDGSDTEIEFAAKLTRVGGRPVALCVVLLADGLRGPSRAVVGRTLTRREREVVTLIAFGRNTGQVADDLHIAQETVKSHVRNAMTKLRARTRAHLVAIALCTHQIVYLPHLEEDRTQ